MDRKKYKQALFTPFRSALFSFCLFGLVSCGGSSGGGVVDQPPEPLTGVFVDSPVEGLHYSTPSRSGMTNANGEFQYLPGETVTFSIGAVELGSTTGRAEITPFTLFGLTAPQDLNEINEVLNDGEVSDLDRVANITTLLVSLDADNNPENGINLGNWNATLTSAILDFDSDHSSFNRTRFREFSESFSISQAESGRALGHLFSSLDISVDFFRRTSRTITRTEDGLETYRQTTSTTYDENGKQLTDTVVLDRDGDGEIDLETSAIFTYDENGKRTNISVQTDRDQDGEADTITEQSYTYDENGNGLTETRETDTDVDGTVDLILSFTYTYDSRGNRLSFVSGSERPEPVSDFITVTSYTNRTYYTYDENDNLITETRERIEVGTEEVEPTQSTTRTYDQNGLLLTVRQTRFISSSGPFSASYSNILATFTYADDGTRTQVTYEHFSMDGNEAIAIETISFTYNDLGQLVAASSSWDGGIGGIDGLVDSTSTASLEYDADGNLISSAYAQNPDANGSDEFSSRRTYTYDEFGNLVTELREYDTIGDGLYDRSEFRVSEWQRFTVDLNLDNADQLQPECPLQTVPIILNGCVQLTAQPATSLSPQSL